MSRCEDWPCCSHESGCCPDFDSSGKQLNMKCTCGATVPITSRYSLCQSCLNRGDPEDYDGGSPDFDSRSVYDGDEEEIDGEEGFFYEDQHLDGMGEE